MKKLLYIVFLIHYLFAWGNTGHRVVGKVAEDRLSNKAKRQIKNIFGHHDLAYLSFWSDEIRSDPNWEYASDWHYATIPDGELYEPGKYPGQLIEKINEFSTIANSSKSDLEQKKQAIKWLVHLVGDLHQPLHVGNGKDRGANDIKVKWFGELMTLHKVWDEKLLDYQNLSYMEYVAFLKIKFDEKQCKKWLTGDLISYAHESREYRKICYIYDNENLGYQYTFTTRPVLDMRLMQAGVRLADLLNKIFN
tara:strand:+ start:41 stop:790 length:750 start_codon:yes stop_codon:yes gene_type:complete